MAFRQVLSKAILPNFERDVARIVQKEVDSVQPFLDTMMSPSAYGFYSQVTKSGAFHSSGLREAATSAGIKRVNIPIKQRGMFE